MSQALYSQRLSEHLKHAQSFCAAGDYVQAGEKIWGALSALVNSRYPTPVFKPEHKKRRFVAMLQIYQTTHPGLLTQMQALGLRRLDDIFHNAYGLHKYFYGGAHYNNRFLSRLIPFLIQLIANL